MTSLKKLTRHYNGRYVALEPTIRGEVLKFGDCCMSRVQTATQVRAKYRGDDLRNHAGTRKMSQGKSEDLRCN